MAITWQAEDTTEPIADTTIEGIANFQNYSTVSGCAATYNGATMVVAIAAGSVLHNGSVVAVAGNSVTLVSDATNPRWTWIGISSVGVATIISGTPAATPTVPELGDYVCSQLVLVQANLTIATNATAKLDKRVIYTPAKTVLTTTGDVLYASAANTLARLGVGSTNQALGVTGGIPAWQASSKSVLTTTGDVMYASAANVPARLAIGSTGQTLTVSGGLPVWAGQVTSIGAILDGGGAAIAANTIIYVRVPFACTINEFTILADQSGSITVKVYKDTYANYPPIAADDISNGGLAVTTATKATDTTLTGWTTAIAAGDVLAFTNTTLATSITRATCQLKVTRA